MPGEGTRSPVHPIPAEGPPREQQALANTLAVRDVQKLSSPQDLSSMGTKAGR